MLEYKTEQQQFVWEKLLYIFGILLLLIFTVDPAFGQQNINSALQATGSEQMSGGAVANFLMQQGQLLEITGQSPSIQPKTLVDHMLQMNRETLNVYDTGFRPPDPMIAVGPNHVVVTVNSDIEWFTKDGIQEHNQPLEDFFSEESPQTQTFDPKVVYDQFAERFVVITLETTSDSATSDTTSKIFIAASDDNDPNGNWYTTTINSKLTYNNKVHWADYPGLAVGANAIYVTGNMFVFGGGGDGSRLWIIDKSQLYANSTPSINRYDPYTQVGHSNFGFTMQPAMVYGAHSGFDTFLSTYNGITNGTDEFVTTIRISNPLNSPTFSYQSVNIGNADSTQLGIPAASQLGSDSLLSTNDRRMLDVVWRNNNLWMAFTVNPPTGADQGQATAHWVKVNTSNLSSLTFVDGGNIGGEDIAPGTSTFFPSIAVDNNDNAAIGFAACGSSIYPGAYYSVILSGNLPGTESYTGVLREGLDYYVNKVRGRNRWGDYTGMAIDPSNNETFWVFNEYAIPRGGGAPNDGRWGTAFGSFGTEQPFVVAGTGFDGIAPVSWRSDVDASAKVVTTPDLEVIGELSRPLPESSVSGNAKSTAQTSSADHFNIYKAADFSGPYQVIAQVDPSTHNYLNNKDFIDTGVTNNSTYYYAVTSVDALGNESGFSGASSVTPIAEGHLIQSPFTSTAPSIDGILGSDWDNSVAFGMNSVSNVDNPVKVYIQNNNNTLSIAVEDLNNNSDLDYNEVGIYLDTNNDGHWPVNDAANEGNYWITDDNGNVTTSFRPIFGTYPGEMNAGEIVTNPAGVIANASWSNPSNLTYEMNIDLATSGIDLQAGDTLGIRIYNYDGDRFTNAYYGVENWPYGSIWVVPQSYAKLVLGTDSSPRLNAPVISAVEDVPRDQGGQLSISWQASSAENSSENPVGYYRIWQRTQPETSVKSSVKSILSSTSSMKQSHAAEIAYGQTGQWVAVDSISARGELEYSRVVSTKADSNQNGLHSTDLKVAAYSSTGNNPIFSEIHSGYSKDNLAPYTPKDVSISGNSESVTLCWISNNDPDIKQYAIYRTSNAATLPSPRTSTTNLYTTDTLFAISGSDVASDFYRIAAVDQNGNMSDYSDPVSMKTTATTDQAVTPDQFALQQNYPNPFNPTTHIKYAVPRKAYVKIMVYDLLGNYVATLVKQTQSAGWYTIAWDGTDQKHEDVGTGIYLYRIEAGPYRAVKKMIYMK